MIFFLILNSISLQAKIPLLELRVEPPKLSRQAVAIDSLNEKQNRIRQQIEQAKNTLNEMEMSLSNLQMELSKNEQLKEMEKTNFIYSVKLAYKEKYRGILPVLLSGESLVDIFKRLRWLQYTLSKRGQTTAKLIDRFNRLRESTEKLTETQREHQQTLLSLEQKEFELKKILKRKSELARKVTFPRTDRVFNGWIAREPHLPPLEKIKAIFPLVEGRILESFSSKGIEIESRLNAEVKSILSGTVEYQGWIQGLGNVILIKHSESGLYSLFAHLYKVRPKTGEKVEQGETVGWVGDTGLKDRSSLYFEVRRMGKPIDPLTLYSNGTLHPFKKES